MKKALTLAELVVVIVILAILAAVIISHLFRDKPPEFLSEDTELTVIFNDYDPDKPLVTVLAGDMMHGIVDAHRNLLQMQCPVGEVHINDTKKLGSHYEERDADGNLLMKGYSVTTDHMDRQLFIRRFPDRLEFEFAPAH
jgi:prepilin-type N-terminal cleavage/methylation domain-containing protein